MVPFGASCFGIPFPNSMRANWNFSIQYFLPFRICPYIYYGENCAAIFMNLEKKIMNFNAATLAVDNVVGAAATCISPAKVRCLE